MGIHEHKVHAALFSVRNLNVCPRFFPRRNNHACNVMAQYLDNDQDGCADDINVVKTMRLNQAGMGMTASASKPYYEDYADGFRGQDLFADETQPSCSGSSDTSDCRDAALEEILHLITSSGVSLYYSNNFGECYRGVNNRSEIQKKMDIARGGHFTSVPTSHPDGAVYTYDDKTCDYACMLQKYFIGVSHPFLADRISSPSYDVIHSLVMSHELHNLYLYR